MRAMLREGIRLLKNLPGSVDVAQTVQHLGFDAFSVVVWGHVLGADVYDWFLTLAATGDRRMKLDLMAPLLPPINPWFYTARRKWFALFSSLIEKAKEPDQPPRSDLLSVLLKRGRPSSDAFRDAMANIFFGGVFSAFSAVTTSLYLLAHHPDVEQRLRAELGALAGRDPDYGLDALENCVISIAYSARRCAFTVRRRSISATPPGTARFRLPANIAAKHPLIYLELVPAP